MEDFDFWAVEQSNGESLKILSRGSHMLGEEKRPKPCELDGGPGGSRPRASKAASCRVFGGRT